jgi:hypothetical protein
MNDIRKKFGYEAMVEKEAIRKRLLSEGVSGTNLFFADETEYQKAHANDLSLREKQALKKQNQPITVTKGLFLTEEEIEYLQFILEC